MLAARLRQRTRHLLCVAMMCSWATASAQDLIALEQSWSDSDRHAFYSTSPGSQIMPYGWFTALEEASSERRFLADGLARYGYLPYSHPDNPDRLPVGFVVDRDRLGVWIGMTCAACHTGRIAFDGRVMQIDGAPSQSDFFSFISGLGDSLDAVVADRRSDKFVRFADRALRNIGRSRSETARDALFEEITRFAAGWRDLVDSSRSSTGWGHGRLDAQGMLINRIGAIDLAVPENGRQPGAPASYPYLWGTSFHDRAQWNGVIRHDTLLGRLGRNVGEVLGAFGKASLTDKRPYYPTTVKRFNVLRIERLLRRLWSPQWREDILGPIDWQAAEAGEALYDAHCRSCHAVVAHGAQDTAVQVTLTPIRDEVGGGVGTDATLARDICARAVRSGRLEGHSITGGAGPLPAETSAIALVAQVIEGALVSPVSYGSSSIISGLLKDGDLASAQLADRLGRITTRRADDGPIHDDPAALAERIDRDLQITTPDTLACGPDSPLMRYKARPLDGIWATAPYLHNGSVASLYELLLPAEARKRAFHTGGIDFDPVDVGFDTSPGPGRMLFDTSLPGNGNAGHDTYGNATFTEEQRRALVEYLKTL